MRGTALKASKKLCLARDALTLNPDARSSSEETPRPSSPTAMALSTPNIVMALRCSSRLRRMSSSSSIQVIRETTPIDRSLTDISVYEDYSTVKVLFDEVKARTDTIIGLGSAYANVGFDSLFERSNNGVIIETYLPDGTKVVGYRYAAKHLPSSSNHMSL